MAKDYGKKKEKQAFAEEKEVVLLLSFSASHVS